MARRRVEDDDSSSEEEEEEEEEEEQQDSGEDASSSDEQASEDEDEEDEEEEDDSDFEPSKKKKKVTAKAGGGAAASKKAGPTKKASSGGGGGKKKPPAAKPAAKKKAAAGGWGGGGKGRPRVDEDEDQSSDEEEEEEEEEGRGGRRRGSSSTAGAAAAKGKGKGKGKATKGKGKGGGGGGGGDSSKVDKVLEEVRQLMLRSRRDDAPNPTLAELGITTVREVSDMAPEGVLYEIERTVLAVAGAILRGEGFSYHVPTRSATNQLYIAELDRIVLSDKVATRMFLNPREVRKTAITTRILQLVHEVLSKGIHITKRDMFYTDVKLFKDQKDSDVVLDDVACMLGCTRSCLNVVASEKGLVVGRVQFEEDGDFIDCTRMGVGGKAIPPYVDKIQNIQSDAKFILLVEKEAAYMRLAEDRFYNKYPCIVITAKGQPDVATRLFLKKLKTTLHIPVLGLVDSDPYGLKILSVYMTGSKNMSYDSASLTTSDIKWLGVRPSDLDKYNIPAQCRLDMTEHDIKTGKQLLQEEFIQKNPEWVKELELMLKMKKKAEIQALSAFGFQYITEDYLPRKLEKGDWI